MRNIENFVKDTNFIIDYSSPNRFRFHNERFKFTAVRYEREYVLNMYEPSTGLYIKEENQYAKTQKEIIEIIKNHARRYQYGILEEK